MKEESATWKTTRVPCQYKPRYFNPLQISGKMFFLKLFFFDILDNTYCKWHHFEKPRELYFYVIISNYDFINAIYKICKQAILPVLFKPGALCLALFEQLKRQGGFAGTISKSYFNK